MNKTILYEHIMAGIKKALIEAKSLTDDPDFIPYNDRKAWNITVDKQADTSTM